jgi:hypothetical protein
MDLLVISIEGTKCTVRKFKKINTNLFHNPFICYLTLSLPN